MATTRRLVVGITGASGALYAQRTIQLLTAANIETHLVVSPLGQRLLHDELGMEGVHLDALSGAPDRSHLIKHHHFKDVGAVLASGSFIHDGMLIVPCSSNSLSAIAAGSQQNLIHRAAAVTLKERRRLVLLHREMPLALTDIRNMELATTAGAIVCPASPGFYMQPYSINDLVDFVVARILALVGVDHGLDMEWSNQKPPPRTPHTTPCN
ncbi:MAG: aromatic acid decarboxylase [Phycisphaeraceae bacterium]|nr:aromatic acid decarboxylase [Phycisphaeraceae bacterium]